MEIAGILEIMTQYLNLGCGTRSHPSWTNIDFGSTGTDVIAHDLKQGIPFQNSSFEVVYHSHLLEHFPKTAALPFLFECYRVLKFGGIIRVAVPDLERIARIYLQAVEEASNGDIMWRHHYEWVKLEMYDQTVRERSGGEMVTYLNQETIPNKEFVLNRIGIEGKKILENAERIRNRGLQFKETENKLVPILYTFLQTLRIHSTLKELLIRLILGKEYEMLQLGRFRSSGEIHLWMYDRYSLSKLLTDAGFKNLQFFGPAESHIVGWDKFNLDTELDGTIYKPDSIYMEGVKT